MVLPRLFRCSWQLYLVGVNNNQLNFVLLEDGFVIFSFIFSFSLSIDIPRFMALEPHLCIPTPSSRLSTPISKPTPSSKLSNPSSACPHPVQGCRTRPVPNPWWIHLSNSSSSHPHSTHTYPGSMKHGHSQVGSGVLREKHTTAHRVSNTVATPISHWSILAGGGLIHEVG